MEIFAPNTSTEEVGILQERLKEFGFYQGSVTSVFDQATQDAVKKFQEDNSLVVDGLVGLMTLHALGLLEIGLINFNENQG
jgi:N-acetylmuramoyl-L-alanine amidase